MHDFVGGIIMDSDCHGIYREGRVINPDKPITIRDHVWIAMNCTILKGVFLPEGVVIAAGSTVTKPLSKERCIYVDNTIVKEDVNWEK